VLKYENNIRFHALATLIVIALGCYFNLNKYEWMAIVFAIGIVWITEIINTAIEKLVDFISPQFDKKTGAIKDMAAGAVLVASFIAFVVGLLVFGSHIYN
jgi:diacylglycerol kinase (ATP)